MHGTQKLTHSISCHPCSQPVGNVYFAFKPCQMWAAAGEEERRRAHEALEAQEAELARYAEQVAADQQQAAALQAKIKAMEEKARPSLSFFNHCWNGLATPQELSLQVSADIRKYKNQSLPL